GRAAARCWHRAEEPVAWVSEQRPGPAPPGWEPERLARSDARSVTRPTRRNKGPRPERRRVAWFLWDGLPNRPGRPDGLANRPTKSKSLATARGQRPTSPCPNLPEEPWGSCSPDSPFRASPTTCLLRRAKVARRGATGYLRSTVVLFSRHRPTTARRRHG